MRRAVLAALLLVAVVAAPAVADDKGVYAHWVSRDREFKKLSHKYVRGERIWRQSGMTRPKPALRAIRKTVNVIDELYSGFPKASSDAGRRGRALAVKSLLRFRRSL